MSVAPPPEQPAGSPTAESTLSVRVRYFAGARSAAGVTEETVPVGDPGAATVTVADVVDTLLMLHDERLAKIVPACSFLVNGIAVRDQGSKVPDGAEFDVLPPFAGG